jgi:hypothetical protein
MTAGRKPMLPAQTIVVDNEKAFSEAAESQALTSAADRVIMDSAEALMKAGQIQALDFCATVASKAIVEIYLSLKHSKAYKGLPYMDASKKARHVASFDEFCEVFLKKSQRRCQELASNYHLLGAELYDQAEALGFKQRDYNAIKALPADDQAAIKAAVEADDRDQVLDLIQELAVRHASEKSLFNTQLESKDADLKARDAREAKLNADNHDLLKKVIRIEEATPQEDYAMLAAELAKRVYAIQASLMSLRGGFSALIDKGNEHGIACTATLIGHVTQLHRELNQVRNEYGLPIEPDKTDTERGFDFVDAQLTQEQADRDRIVN